MWSDKWKINENLRHLHNYRGYSILQTHLQGKIPSNSVFKTCEEWCWPQEIAMGFQTTLIAWQGTNKCLELLNEGFRTCKMRTITSNRAFVWSPQYGVQHVVGAQYSFSSLFPILRDFQSQGPEHGGFQINAEITRISNEIVLIFPKHTS